MLIILEYYVTPKSVSSKINDLTLIFFCLKCPFSFAGAENGKIKAKMR